MSKTRLTVLMLLCIFGGMVVLCRAAYIQLMGQPRLEAMARRQFVSNTLIRPRRGPILDRNGEPLAVNVETFSLAANPGKIKKKRIVARLLSRSTDIPHSKLLQKLSENREFVWIKRHLSDGELKRFKKWRVIDDEGDFISGLWLVKESERIYPHHHLAAHVLGDVNIDSEGLEGTELWMNSVLQGKVVSVAAVKDALGRPTFMDAVAAKSVKDGEAVTLTIDASLQFEIEQELSRAIQRTGARSGTVIVMNAANGEILAMANEPGFNSNEKGAPPDKRRNRAVTDGFEPGSTLKAILLSSALSSGWKLSDELWGERGSFLVQDHRISEAEAKEKFEWISLKKMIQVSSNVGAAKLALKIGSDRYLRTLRAFGFGSKTGLEFPGEIAGKLPPRKEWSPLTLANIGFGQGILVTPLQVTRAYAAILNGGWLVQPSLIKGAKKEIPVRIMSQRVSHDVASALVSVIEPGGTGAKAALDYRVAGKTGTAQMVDPLTGRYSRDKYIASFVGFALGVDPKIVIFTSLNEPKGGYYAATTTAPLFREVLSSVANRCSLPMRLLAQPLAKKDSQPQNLATDSLKVSQALPVVPIHWNPSSGQVGSTGAPTPLPIFEGRKTGWVMPGLKGLTPRESIRVLKGYPFKLEVLGNGVVTSQHPESGKRVAEGDTIRLHLSEP